MTRVSDSGAIQIPFEAALFDQEVEVIILTKPTPAKRGLGAREFVQKWAGFLSDRDETTFGIFIKTAKNCSGFGCGEYRDRLYHHSKRSDFLNSTLRIFNPSKFPDQQK